MYRGLGGRVGWRVRARHEGEAGGDVHHGGERLVRKVRQQGRGEADRAQQIGGDRGLGDRQGIWFRQHLLHSHDARIVDEHIEALVLRHHARDEVADHPRVIDVEQGEVHARIGRYHGLQRRAASPGDVHGVARVVQRFV